MAVITAANNRYSSTVREPWVAIDGRVRVGEANVDVRVVRPEFDPAAHLQLDVVGVSPIVEAFSGPVLIELCVQPREVDLALRQLLKLSQLCKVRRRDALFLPSECVHSRVGALGTAPHGPIRAFHEIDVLSRSRRGCLALTRCRAVQRTAHLARHRAWCVRMHGATAGALQESLLLYGYIRYIH